MQKGRRSYYSQRNLEKGEIIKPGDFKALRPYVKNSFKADSYFDFLGKKLKKKIKISNPLKFDHI